jgi:hypothetical protein
MHTALLMMLTGPATLGICFLMERLFDREAPRG